MSLFQKYRLLRVQVGLLLICAITLNTGCQFDDTFSADRPAMELNDHTDHEGESDKEEENKSDDVFSYDLKGMAFYKVDLSKTHRAVLLDYSRNHPDIFTPPPEYFG